MRPVIVVGASLVASSIAIVPATTGVTFTDLTEASGVSFRHAASKTSVKFLPETMGGGVAVFDADGDGRLDLFFTNGARVTTDTMSAQPPDKRDPRFWNRVYRNLGGWKFKDVTEQSGVAGTRYDFGAAAAGYDNDGDIDLHVTGLGGNSLLRNDGGNANHWLTVSLRGTRSNRQGIGAIVSVVDEHGRTASGICSTSSSYLSVSGDRVHFGLAAAKRVRRVEVRWASGAVQVLKEICRRPNFGDRRAVDGGPAVRSWRSCRRGGSERCV
jgi:hypothetical protein